jgi:ribosome-associated protein
MKNIDLATIFSFSRSSGPGGQNVNKVETKVQATCDLEKLGLNAEQLAMLKTKLATKLIDEQFLVVSEQSTRSQLKNKALALAKINKLIINALIAKKPRKNNEPTAASIAKRLIDKKRNAEIKKLRAKI